MIHSIRSWRQEFVGLSIGMGLATALIACDGSGISSTAAVTAADTPATASEPTAVPIPATATPTPEPTATATPTATNTPTPQPTSTPTPTPEPTATPTPEVPTIYEKFAAVSGPWEGAWVNETFGSTGAARAVFSVLPDGVATFTLDLDGGVFGLGDPPPLTFDGAYDESGGHFSAEGHPLFGNMTLTIAPDGALTLESRTIPLVNIDLDLTGTLGPEALHATYTVALPGGATATGTFDLAKVMVVQDNGVLVTHVGDTVEAVLDVQDLPQMWNPETRQEDSNGFGVDATAFATFAISPDGQWIAWATSETVHALIGLVHREDQTVVVLDFIFDGSIASLAWAPDSLSLAAATLPPSLPTVVVYSIGLDAQGIFEPPLSETLGPQEEWATTGPVWQSTTELQVTAQQGANPPETWTFTLPEGTAAKSE